MAHGGGSVANTLITNGATLEDCHTNIFVLTEVTGLKWCRYTAPRTEVEVCTDVCEDPILRAYSNCLKQDLLCVWRRIPSAASHSTASAGSSTKIDLRLAAEKELWVFWYGEEQPPSLPTACSTLSKAEDGDWKGSVEYDTRQLLFKALHNLLERSLLAKEYVRLGRWFVQPLNADDFPLTPKFLLAFAFSFFIHGEGNVCVCVSVQRQPPICRLSRAHLSKRESGVAQKVLLAPFCITANLSRQCHVNADSDSQASKLWREWSDFYPLPEHDNTENMGYVDAAEKERQDQLRALAPPRMVEVVVSGVRVKYPTAYVLVECESAPGTGASNAGAAGGDKPEQSNAARMVDCLATAAESGPIFSGLLLQRAAEDLAIGISSGAPSGRRSSQTGASTPTPETQQQSDDVAGSWDFVDNTHKDACGCGRSLGNFSAVLKSSSPMAPAVLNKAQLKFGYTSAPAGSSSTSVSTTSHSSNRHQRLLERQNRFGKSGPFHRRQLTTRSSAATNSGAGQLGSVPSLEAQVPSSESDATPGGGRMVTTPVTPSATMTSMAISASCPVVPPMTSSAPSVAAPRPIAPPPNCATKSAQQSKMGVAAPASSNLVLVKPSPVQTSIISLGRRKRRRLGKLHRRLWKRPRLSATNRNENGDVGFGLSCPMDEAAPLPPAYPETTTTVNWCVKKHQKYELARAKPFATPAVPVSSLAANPYPVTMMKISPVQSHQQSVNSTTVADIGSGVPAGGHPTSPVTTTANKNGENAFSIPENIMEDSPDGLSNELLSPPPSHGRDDETNAHHFASRPLVNHAMPSTTNPTAPPASRVDYTMIYPTPPSIETPAFYGGQFSPEGPSMVVPFSGHQSMNGPISHATIAKNPTCGEYSSAALRSDSSKFNGGHTSSIVVSGKSSNFVAHLIDRLQKVATVVDKDRVAKYLLADTYSPRSLTNGRQRATSTMTSSLPVWSKSDNPKQAVMAGRPLLPQLQSSIIGQMRPPSPFAYTFCGQHSAPGSPMTGLPPPPPYMAQRGWPSPAAVGSPFAARAGGPRTPASAGGIYDIQSPVSSSSSMCLRNDNSVECATIIGQTPSSALSTGGALVTPEGHGLVLSLLMCDTIADLFRDGSFDSCPLCVCSMSILGVDAGVYIVVSSAAASAAAQRQASNCLQNQQSLKCNCGFSAVRYRNLSWRAGLFYEDEYEATGVWPWSNEPTMGQEQDNQRISSEFMNLIRYKANTDYNLTADSRIAALTSLSNFSSTKGVGSALIDYVRPMVEMRDLSEMCNLAVEQACLMMDCTKPSRDDFHGGGISGLIAAANSRHLVADWGYMKATQQAANAEACFVLRTLAPILQESMQKSRGGGTWATTKQPVTTVEGPLTWRHLHRKCNSGQRAPSETRTSLNDCSAPEPIPLLLLATDRDWISVSPFALRSWDKLPLEPYGQPKDVVYVAVVPDNSVPDNSVVQQKARQFFRSLSKTYESLRLGRHCPLTKVLKDGIMPVNKKYAEKLSQASVDPAFDQLIQQCPRLGAKLKSYAQICRHYLAPHLGTENVFDRSIFRDIGKDSSSGGDGSSSMPPPSSIPGKEEQASSSAAASENDGEGNDVDSPVPHTVVIYIVDAFTFGPSDREDAQFSRVAAAGLYRCYLEVLRDLPDSVKTSVQMEIVPLQSIFETSFSDVVAGCSQADYLRRLAFSVFQQPRSVDFSCLSSSVAKPLTGFGTAASRLELIRRKAIQQKDSGGFGNYYRAHCPKVVLAPTFAKSASALSSDGRDDDCRVLMVSYCLSERQEWLLATATDHQGTLQEDCTIDLRVSNRRCITRRPIPPGAGSSPDQGPEGSLIWESLRKLWNFITALLSTATHPWRIVIGRLGRLGHEELKAWAHFLCRSRLRLTSKLIRERCGMCAALPTLHDSAIILSACLISTEPDPSLRLFPNSFAHDDRFGLGGKHCPLSTPEDVSNTHIMVFPTSAAIHSAQNAIAGSISGNVDDPEDFAGLFDGLDDLPGAADLSDMADVFGTDNAFTDESGRPFQHHQPILSEAGDELIQLQPLALGYLVSTAPPGWLPSWFWTNRPSGRNEVPVHLRSALHIHTSGVQQSDEQFLGTASSSTAAGGGFAGGGSRNAAQSHPLDSSLTTDVLRYVLETYNSLSWLTFDTRSGDRQTCMPVHIQHLCRLYRAMDGFDSTAARSSPTST